MIANVVDEMNAMLKVCKRFCEYTKLTFEPSKSKVYGYDWNNTLRRRVDVPIDAIKYNDIPLLNTNENDSIRYLGIDNSAHKSTFIRISSDIEMDFKVKLKAICNSDLFTV